jgi:hypothetical protein
MTLQRLVSGYRTTEAEVAASFGAFRAARGEWSQCRVA